jgi:hypothetical protein
LQTLFAVVTLAAVVAATAKAFPQFAVALSIVLAVSVAALMAMTLLAFWEWIVFRTLKACRHAIFRHKDSPDTQADEP